MLQQRILQDAKWQKRLEINLILNSGRRRIHAVDLLMEFMDCFFFWFIYGFLLTNCGWRAGEDMHSVTNQSK